MERTRTASRPNSPPVRSIVLIDGSALFLAVKAIGEGRSLDYRALIELLCKAIPSVSAPSGNGDDDLTHWVMWTSWSPENSGQTRFLEFAERDLLWAVRRFNPSDSFLVDPASASGPSADPKLVSRLTRFDSAIAFAMGRIAEDRRIVLVSDSFPLAEPLRRAWQLRRTPGDTGNSLAFFGRALDPRWQRVLRGESLHHIKFVDLDEHEADLFGGTTREVQRRYEDDLPF